MNTGQPINPAKVFNELNMIRRFHLKNKRSQYLATVIYFFEDQINSNVGIIITPEAIDQWLYQDDSIENVIQDLATRINIEYVSIVEVSKF